jgi:hypothetical protein
MSSPIVADPTIVKFIETVAAGANAAADSVAGMLLRLASRSGRVEQTLAQRAEKIKKLEREPKSPRRAPMRVVETGIDVRDGSPVHIEEQVKRPRASTATTRIPVGTILAEQWRKKTGRKRGRPFKPNARRHRTDRAGRRGEVDGGAPLRAKKRRATGREDVEITPAGVLYGHGPFRQRAQYSALGLVTEL